MASPETRLDFKAAVLGVLPQPAHYLLIQTLFVLFFETTHPDTQYWGWKARRRVTTKNQDLGNTLGLVWVKESQPHP